MELALLAGLAAVALILANLAGMHRAGHAAGLKPAPHLPDGESPPSIVAPLCGLEGQPRTLEASCISTGRTMRLPVLRTAAQRSIIPLVEAIARHQTRRAMLLVGDPSRPIPSSTIASKGWAARHDYIVANSNALVPPDYIAPP